MTFSPKFYLSIFFRRFHYFLVVAGLVSTVGVTVATMLPAEYEAAAILRVERAQIPQDLASSTVQTGVGEQVQIIQQELTSRAAVLEMADKMQIYPNRSELDPNFIISDMRQRITIAQPRGRGAATVTVGFRGRDATTTAAVANELVTRLLAQNVELRTGSATQTLEFFEQEVARLSAEIDAQSSNILEFRLQHQNALPDSMEFRRGQQTSLQQRLVQIEREETALVERRANLVDLFERTGRVDTDSANLSPEQRQLQNLQKELDNALLVYSPQNPRIRVLQTRISALEGVVASQSAVEGEEDAGRALFELQLGDIDQQLTEFTRQKEEIATEIARLQDTIDATPENSIRLSELERAFRNVQRQYQSASERLATAEMGERIEVLAKGQRLQLVEQAVVPNAPTSPNRPLIAGGSVGMGFVLGLGLIVLMELLNSSVRRPVDIQNKLNITPIATLPYIRTNRQRRIHDGIIFCGVFIAVIAAPATIWALHTYYLPLDLLIEQVLDQTGLSNVTRLLSGG
ncbi:chain-length determining protein [Roseobacter cerasinus]|uniref:Chain-length determining protein n=1 Tax=Roseobacter cerasinus TaxID=2602289 RepID=A0A640VZG2_9RHOB|nr:lipopolysaccharide biosynthesis protein [Roseobacter cerasinus]GFE52501.1 chain-length determining protein [Roseobacter cerasinus]